MLLTVILKDFEIKFEVLDNPLARLWVERMHQRHQYPLDDPARFYGFNSLEHDQSQALKKINNCIRLIQQESTEDLGGYLTSVYDQDRLNYWHHIFETRHGFLEKEDRSNPLTTVLAELNVAVHRCESVARGNKPRFVCTWYGIPKSEILTADFLQNYGVLNPEFGTVCLNYCEIGKTLEDLARDRDNYISDEAFRPFCHYSADFNVRMYQEKSQDIDNKMLVMKNYYQQHQDFFFERGYHSFDDPRLLPLRFPVAQIVNEHTPEHVISTIAQQQYITQVELE